MSRTIPLTKGYVTIVDDADHPELGRWKWCANVKGENAVYAYRTVGNGPGQPKTSIYMHRLILGILDDKNIEGDHRNGDTLDNRRSNLRLATRRQNATNQALRSDNTSGVRGVDYVKKDRAFRVRVYTGAGEKVVGYTKTLEEAKALRERAQAEVYGEDVRAADPGGQNE